MTEVTAEVVAEWMFSKVTAEDVLYQCEAADGIKANFGDAFVYENENGTLAIGKNVLKAFKALTASTVVWNGSGKYWRQREASDTSDRRTSD